MARRRKPKGLTGRGVCPVPGCGWRGRDLTLMKAANELVEHLHTVHEQREGTLEEAAERFAAPKPLELPL